MEDDQGGMRLLVVTHRADGRFTVGGNHPLPEEAIHVTVRTHDIRDPTRSELGMSNRAGSYLQ